MEGANKVIAIMLIAFLAFGILFSYDYLIEHAQHDCSGEHCADQRSCSVSFGH